MPGSRGRGARRYRIRHRRLTLCEPCGKWRFASEVSALSWLAEVGSRNRGSRVRGVYRCEHDWYHLTSKPRR